MALRMEELGEYKNEQARTITGSEDGRAYIIPAANYPVIGAIDDNDRVVSAGIVFEAFNWNGGDIKKLDAVHFHEPKEILAMVKEKKIELARPEDERMLKPDAIEKQHERKQTHRLSVGA